MLVPSSLAGVVVDPGGKPVADAGVSAQSDALEGSLFAQADASGHFDLGGLPPGRYELTARRPWPQDDGSPVDGPPVEVTTPDRHVRLVGPDQPPRSAPAVAAPSR